MHSLQPRPLDVKLQHQVIAVPAFQGNETIGGLAFAEDVTAICVQIQHIPRSTDRALPGLEPQGSPRVSAEKAHLKSGNRPEAGSSGEHQFCHAVSLPVRVRRNEAPHRGTGRCAHARKIERGFGQSLHGGARSPTGRASEKEGHEETAAGRAPWGQSAGPPERGHAQRLAATPCPTTQKKGRGSLKFLAGGSAVSSLRWMREMMMYPVVLFFGVPALLAAGCSSPADPKKPDSTKPKAADLVDCNYFWPNRNRHVCIKDMPKRECEDLFFMVEFQRDRQCVCDEKGRDKNAVRGSGYVQYDCQ